MLTSQFIDKMGHKKDMREVVESSRVVGTSLVGVEVELENMFGLNGEKMNYWSIIKDGSLKNNGYEFIFNQPLGGSDIVNALRELEGYITFNGHKPDLSERTSVHVHIDVRDLTKTKYMDFVLLYLVFEMSLFHHCGIDRASNCFSMPWSKLNRTIEHLSECTTDTSLIRFISDLTRNKYTSLNLGATNTFGSIEFRGHGGEWRSKPLLVWINMLLSLKKYIQTNNIAWDSLVSDISYMGTEKFTTSVFGEYSSLLEYPNQSYDILQGVRLAQDIIYTKDIRGCYKNYGQDNVGELIMNSGDTVSKRFKKYLNRRSHSNRHKPKRGVIE